MKYSVVPWLWDPVNYSLTDSYVHRIFQSSILEWVVISSSRGSWNRDWTCSLWTSCIIGWFFTTEPPGKLRGEQNNSNSNNCTLWIRTNQNFTVSWYNTALFHFWSHLFSSVGKESVYNSGDPDWILELGRSAGEGIGHPLQYFWVSLVAQLVKSLTAMQETWFWSLGLEDLLEKGKAAHSSILAWRIHGIYSPWGCKQSDRTEQFSLSLSFLHVKWSYHNLTKEPLDESERGEWKSWLKTQHSENYDHGIQSHHFMANRWGNSGISGWLFFWSPKALQMVTAVMKLKDAYSLEEKLWPTWIAY